MRFNYWHVVSIALVLLITVSITASCRTKTVGLDDPGGQQNVVDPANRSGLALATAGDSPVLTALAAELGLADLDFTDAESLAGSVAEAAVIAFDAEDLAAGLDANAESILAAAEAAGVPILFENGAALEECQAILEQMESIDPAALLDFLNNYESSAELDATMAAMADAVGLGVDSQLALYIPVLNNGVGIVDGEAVESTVYMLGATQPLEVLNVTSLFEDDGAPVPDADVPDPDDMTADDLQATINPADLADPAKLLPSLAAELELDPAELVTELLTLLNDEVVNLQTGTPSEASTARTVSWGQYESSPPAGVSRKEWNVYGSVHRWYPCDRDQLCRLRIKVRVQLYDSARTASGDETKYVRILGNRSYWHMDGAQQWDEDDDQGYYMIQGKTQAGVCNSSGSWTGYPDWLRLYSQGNVNELTDSSTYERSETGNLYYNDASNRTQTWNARWEENIDRNGWHMDEYTGTGRVTWRSRMVRDYDGNQVSGWNDMFDGGRALRADDNFARGGSPGMISNNAAIWQTIPAKSTGNETQRFRVYHKMWVRNTWIEDGGLFGDDERKHREDHARKNHTFYVNFGDV